MKSCCPPGRCNKQFSHFTDKAERCFYPLLNFLKGGRMTLRLFTTQCLPTLTLARSPLIMQSFMTMVWNTKHTRLNYITALYKNITALSDSFTAEGEAGVFSLLCHWGRCFDSRREPTVCSLCCQKPDIKGQKGFRSILHSFAVFIVYLERA